MKLAMVIDSSRCLDCKACMLACKSANMVPQGFWRNWVKESRPGSLAASGATPPLLKSHFQPGACMHCANATCVQACPSGATSQNAYGEVIIDKGLCIGCASCIKACPYGARYLHPQLHVADKCDYCAARRAQGLQPACVDTCPTRARTFGDLDDPQSPAALRLAQYDGKAKLVEDFDSPTAPRMLYVKDTPPAYWTNKAEISTPITLMNMARPALSVLAGLTGLGIAAAVLRQWLLPDKPETQEHAPSPEAKTEASKENGHE